MRMTRILLVAGLAAGLAARAAADGNGVRAGAAKTNITPPFVSIMSNGTSGNINNIDYSKPAEKLPPYRKMRIVAEDVAQAVYAAYQKIEWRDQVKLGASFEEITLALRRPTPEQIERAKGIIASMAPEKK